LVYLPISPPFFLASIPHKRLQVFARW